MKPYMIPCVSYSVASKVICIACTVCTIGHTVHRTPRHNLLAIVWNAHWELLTYVSQSFTFNEAIGTVGSPYIYKPLELPGHLYVGFLATSSGQEAYIGYTIGLIILKPFK